MVFIIAVHMEGRGTGHEHIAAVRWRNPETNDTGSSTRQAVVDWISNGGVAKVTDGTTTVGVYVNPQKYLQTYADNRWTDNLLALPRY